MRIQCVATFLAACIFAAALTTGCARTPEAKAKAFLESGRKHDAAGEYGRAILDFKNAVAATPLDPEAHYQLAMAFAGSGDLAAAGNEYLKTLEFAPKNIDALLKLADLLTNGNDDGAVREGQKRAREALELSPGNSEALQILAAGDLRLADYKAANEHFQAALQKDPRNLKAATMYAGLKLRAKDVAGAEELMQACANAAPRSAEHVVALGRFELQMGKREEAKAQFRRALNLDSKYGPALMALGDVLYREGNPAEAGPLFQRAAALPGQSYRTAHAAFLLESGQGDEANKEYERLYKKDPNDRDVRTGLISSYIRTGRLADASKLIAQALQRDPKDPAALLQRGELLLADRNSAQAETEIATVLQSHPSSVEAHLLMARIHQARNDSAGERRELAEALRLNPRLISTRIDLAHLLTVANEPKAALDLLDAASEDESQTLPVIKERNTAFYAAHDYSGMRKSLDAGLNASPNDPELLLQDGLMRLKQHDLDAGRASLEKALKWSGEDFRALEALAMSYVDQKDISQATRVVRDHTSRLPGSIEAQQFLGMWLARTGDRTGARLAFQTARSMAPLDSKAAHAADFQMAELDIRDGNLDSGRNRLLALLKTQPGDLAVLLDLAIIEYRSGRLADAIGYYERIQQLDPTNLAALNNLAFLLADTGKDPNRALQLALHAKELAPSDPTLNDTLGWVYYVRGDYASAVKYMTLNKNTTPRWKCHLAMAYLKVGKRQQAGEMLEAALKEDPSIPEAKRVQALLNGK